MASCENKYITLLDLSRQAKVITGETACFDGKIQFVQHKTLIPNYDVFDEMRYFDPSKEINVLLSSLKRATSVVCRGATSTTSMVP